MDIKLEVVGLRTCIEEMNTKDETTFRTMAESANRQTGELRWLGAGHLHESGSGAGTKKGNAGSWGTGSS